MTQVIKSGFLQRYSRKFMQEGWKDIWCVLHADGTLAWFKHQNDRSPKGNVNMKNIANFFAVGAHATRVPNAPQVQHYQIEMMLAIPDRPSRDAVVEFFLAHTKDELNDWMQKIVSTLPPQQGQPPQQQAPPPAAGLPPASYSGGPPPVGFGGMPQPGAYPQAPPPGAYPQGAAGYPAAPPAQGYLPQAGYPAQPAYPQQAAYPQQGAYPQQQGYPQQAYAGAQAGYPAQGTYVGGAQGGQPTHQIVYVNGKPKKKKIKTNTALGIAGGAAAGYMLGRMTGGGWGYGGGWGCGGGWGPGFGGGWGSWSSLSSFGSFGSCGSFGSFD